MKRRTRRASAPTIYLSLKSIEENYFILARQPGILIASTERDAYIFTETKFKDQLLYKREKAQHGGHIGKVVQHRKEEK